jgi:hypothetical protein
MNKWLSRIVTDNFNSQCGSDKVDNVKAKLALSTMSPSISCTEEKKSYIQSCKEEELKNLIKKISAYYSGDDTQFLSDYIDDVIKEWSHDLDQAIACFQSLVMQITATKE